jgi:opine dehydrogenase
LRPLIDDPYIDVVNIDGRPVGRAHLSLVTSDAAEAVTGADVVLNPVPIFAYRVFAQLVANTIEEGQVVCTLGKGGGSLVYAKALREAGAVLPILGETNTLPYGATRLGQHQVRIESPTVELITAAFPSRRTGEVVAAFGDLYPEYSIRKAANVLETILVDYNAITHPPPMICNAARIASGYGQEDFHLFGPSENPEAVVRVIEAVDRERIALSRALGIKAYTLEEEINHVGFNPRGKEGRVLPLFEAIHTEKLEVCEGPYSLMSRHLVEDIPYGLVTFCSLGEMLGVPTPVSRALSVMASVLNGEDYFLTGRTVERLGIDPAWRIDQLCRYLEEGQA